MRILKIIKNSLVRVSYYRNDYFISIVVLTLIRTILILPVLSYLFKEILINAGLRSITNQNFFELFKGPLNIFLIILFLILSILFIVYELGYYFLMADAQIRGENYTFKSLIIRLNRKAKYFISIYSFLFVAYLLLLLPVVSIGLNSKLTRGIRIPNFIVDELLLTNIGKFLYFVLTFALLYLSLRLIYTIYFFVTEADKNILKSMEESFSYSKDKTINNFIILILSTMIYSLLISLFVFISMLPVILSDKYLPQISPVTAGISLSLVQIVIFFASGFIQPLVANIVIITTDIEEVPLKEAKRKQIRIFKYLRENKKIKKFLAAAFLVMIAVNIFTVVKIAYQPETLVIAHRGDMEHGVENSIEALKAAADAHADAVEMDIQETKDHKFVVMHDYNLRRLAGKNKKVSNMTLEELQKITIRQNGFTSKIPSLEQYIKMAKRRNIRLLIEVKPHGNESPEMEENLIKVLKDNKVERHFMVQSLDLNIVNKIKELSPEIETGYIIPLNLGELPITKQDFLVLEDFSITKRTVLEADNMGVKLFAWTINDEDTMKKYFKLNINAIITSYPAKAVEIRNSSEDTRTFFNRVEYILGK